MKLKELLEELQGMHPEQLEAELGLDADDTVVPGYSGTFVETEDGRRYLLVSGESWCETITKWEDEIQWNFLSQRS